MTYSLMLDAILLYSCSFFEGFQTGFVSNTTSKYMLKLFDKFINFERADI